jgi:FlaG/FlaF family flagellin (archaellin)
VTLLATQNISRTGLTPAYTAVTGSDTFVPDAQTMIHVKNAGGSPDSCVISVLSGDPPGLVISDVTVSVTNAQERMIGPLPPNFFADPTTGLGTVTHSFTTSVTSGVFKLGQP